MYDFMKSERDRYEEDIFRKLSRQLRILSVKRILKKLAMYDLIKL